MPKQDNLWVLGLLESSGAANAHPNYYLLPIAALTLNCCLCFINKKIFRDINLKFKCKVLTNKNWW